MNRFSALLASASLSLFVTSAHADTPTPGFSLSAQPSPVFGSTSCVLAGGDVVTFDGSTVERWTSTGNYVSTLALLPGATWASFVTPTVDGSTVFFAESSNHGVYQARTDGSGWSQLTTLQLAYDAEVGADGSLYASAMPFGFGYDTDLVRLETVAPFTWTSIGVIPGASGPLTFDGGGNLYYATQDTAFPAGAGTTDILRWTAAQVALGGLTDVNATLVGADFDGGAAMDFDEKGGELLLAEANYGLNEYRIVRVVQDKANSPVLVDAGQWISTLQVIEQGSAATLDAYQPSSGTKLVYATTDFGTFNDLVTLTPKRPVLAASGSGTSGQGPVTLTVTGGVPNGTTFLFFCPQSAYSPTESVYNLPAFKFFTGLPPSNVRRIPFLLPTDANGTGSFTFWNPGDLQGQYAFQALVGGATGSFVGSTTSTLF
ncbi:MAG: hypothetical protein HZA52_03910 [Planctomycetes bacterium]|nr:hypothetical protein [Planctomycetota bacterium]